MSKITRYNGNVVPFANNAQAGERFVFGSSTEQSNDLTTLVGANYLRGWGVVGPSDFPPLEWFNAQAFTHGQFISYLHQMGVPEWNPAQEYPTEGAQTVHNLSLWTRGPDWVLGDEPGVASSTRWSKGVVASDLGTAAALDVTTNVNDTTPNRVTKVGDYGAGTGLGLSNEFSAGQDFNSFVVSAKYFIGGYGNINNPTGTGPASACLDVNNNQIFGSFVSQTVISSENRSFFRFGNPNSGVWQEWRENYHTGNLSSAPEIININSQLFGVDQSWVDVTASRSANTTYTNDTGKPIVVSVMTGQTATSYVIGFDINGSPVKRFFEGDGADQEHEIIVPKDATYSYILPAGAIERWWELR